jgi:hypothetical protein
VIIGTSGVRSELPITPGNCDRGGVSVLLA